MKQRLSASPSVLLAGIAIIMVAVVVLLQRMMTSATEVDLSSLAFEDHTGVAGMTDAARSWGSMWTDVDGDGYPEAVLGRHWRPLRYFRSLGDGRYREHFPRVFILKGFDRHACSWGEANGDGKADLYCTIGADEGRGIGENQLFIQQAPSEFEDRAVATGTADDRGRGRTANWLDYDDDGDLDLFVGNLRRKRHPNQLFRNDGGTFTAAGVGIDHKLQTASSSWSDWDVDGDPDVLVLQHNAQGVAYENVGGRFRRGRLPGLEGGGWLSGAWGDYDADGLPDLHVVSDTEARVLRNTGSSFEVVHTQEVVNGRMSTWFDADNDSDLDVFVVQGAFTNHPSGAENEPDFLIVNTGTGFTRADGDDWRGPANGNGESVAATDHDRDGRVDLFVTNGAHYWWGPNRFLRNVSKGGNWIGIDLRGPPENPMGIGARVQVSHGGRDLHHQMTDGFNAHAQNEVGYLHVGLGKATVVDVEVEWPGGARDCATVATDRVLVVEQASAPCDEDD